MNKTELFEYLCEETARILFYYEPNIYSIPHIIEFTGETKYHIRKLIKELKTDGLIKRASEIGIDENGNRHLYHGWALTDEAMKTLVYRKAEERAIIEFVRENVK